MAGGNEGEEAIEKTGTDILKLIEGIGGAEKRYIKASDHEEKEKIREEIKTLETRIKQVDSNYNFDWHVLLRADERQKYQTNWYEDQGKRKMPEKNLGASVVDGERLKQWVDMLPQLDGAEKKISELLKSIDLIEKAIDKYKIYQRRTLITIGSAFGLAVIVLGILGTNIMKKADTAQTKTNEYISKVQVYEERATNQIEEARKSLDEKIAGANAPMLKRIDEIYAIASVLNERVVHIEADYLILDTIQKNIQELQTDMAADREKYAPILPKLNALEANLAAVIKSKIDEKEYKKGVEDLKESISILREDVNKIRGKNF